MCRRFCECGWARSVQRSSSEPSVIRKHLLEQVRALGREHPVGRPPGARVQGHDPEKTRRLGFPKPGAFNQPQVLRPFAPAVVRHDLRHERAIGAVVHRRADIARLESLRLQGGFERFELIFPPRGHEERGIGLPATRSPAIVQEQGDIQRIVLRAMGLEVHDFIDPQRRIVRQRAHGHLVESTVVER